MAAQTAELTVYRIEADLDDPVGVMLTPASLTKGSILTSSVPSIS